MTHNRESDRRNRESDEQEYARDEDEEAKNLTCTVVFSGAAVTCRREEDDISDANT